MKKERVLGIDISTGRYFDFIEEICQLAKSKTSSYVCVANVHMTIEAYDNEEFAEVVNGADIVTPDGMPIVKLLRMLYGIKQERVAGMDLMPDLLESAAENSIGVYFFGSTREVLDGIREKAGKKFPGLNISGSCSPPFRELSADEEDEIISEIKNSGAGIVMVALGCPKQEKWMARFSPGFRGVMIGLGGAFPVFADKKRRAPVWMQRLSLEWFYRLMKEPGRLWRRYLYTNSKFIFLSLSEIVRKKIFRRY